MKRNLIKYISCSAFGLLYILVACISLICSVEFFRLAHAGTMSWVLAIGFELGAMCCLLSTLILPKEKQALVWFMFVLLTLFQMMGNTYAAYSALDNFQGWIELFGLEEMEPIAQKRVLACISGAILPLVALGFVRTMVNVLQPAKKNDQPDESNEPQQTTVQEPEPEPEAKPEPKPEPEPKVETETTYPEPKFAIRDIEVEKPTPKPEPEPETEPEPEAETEKHDDTTGEIKVEPMVVETPKQTQTPKQKKIRVWNPQLNCYMDEIQK